MVGQESVLRGKFYSAEFKVLYLHGHAYFFFETMCHASNEVYIKVRTFVGQYVPLQETAEVGNQELSNLAVAVVAVNERYKTCQEAVWHGFAVNAVDYFLFRKFCFIEEVLAYFFGELLFQYVAYQVFP